jgi:S-adenosylmethionine-diacylglycerol 3-amino-3-carboxypropyl transferase
LDHAFDRVMSLPNLIALFGATATQNARQPFSRHFAERTRWALANFPAAENPWLWQMLLGEFPPGARYPWLDAPAPAKVPEVTYTVGTMDAALADAAGDLDYVHLSNVLDWLSEPEVRRTLGLAAAALRPGGYTLVRQLNSTLDVRALGPQFDWDAAASAGMHARDRSFFYTALHLGRRR